MIVGASTGRGLLYRLSTGTLPEEATFGYWMREKISLKKVLPQPEKGSSTCPLPEEANRLTDSPTG